MGHCFGNDVAYRPQGPGDLGRRMQRALADAFHDGAARVVVIGADCPGITPRLLRDAFERLAAADVVLRPATDGGYYLIGLPRSGLVQQSMCILRWCGLLATCAPNG